jgi:hypothetical protein
MKGVTDAFYLQMRRVARVRVESMSVGAKGWTTDIAGPALWSMLRSTIGAGSLFGRTYPVIIGETGSRLTSPQVHCPSPYPTLARAGSCGRVRNCLTLPAAGTCVAL